MPAHIFVDNSNVFYGAQTTAGNLEPSKHGKGSLAVHKLDPFFESITFTKKGPCRLSNGVEVHVDGRVVTALRAGGRSV